MLSIDLGKKAEEAACQFLLKHGLKLLLKNYYCKHGEIDLIMQDGDYVVFVEVRSRRYVQYGSALESITTPKILRLIKTADHFLQAKGWSIKYGSRFDVVAIHQNSSVNSTIKWLKNAFQADR